MKKATKSVMVKVRMTPKERQSLRRLERRLGRTASTLIRGLVACLAETESAR